MKACYVLLICLVSGLFSGFASVSNPSEAQFIKLGSAKVAAKVMIVSDEKEADLDADKLLDELDLYVATLPIFAEEGHEELTLMKRDGAIFYAEVPTETKESIGNLQCYRDGHFIGGTPILLKQATSVGMQIYMTSDGDIAGAMYDDLDLKKWMATSVIAEYALSFNPFQYAPTDTLMYMKGWQAINDYKTHEVWPKFMAEVTRNDQIPIPDEAKEWLENNLRMFFAYTCILPYKTVAKRYSAVDVDEPPMEAYSFLDSIDYRPEALLKYLTMLPSRYFFEAILEYPSGGLTPIGNMPVREWQKGVDHMLKPAMENRPQILLDLLAAMSYIRQIEGGVTLSDAQVKNIESGFTDDLGRIVLKLDMRMRAKPQKTQSEVHNLTSDSFALKEYIDSISPGAPIVVDLWNTWCGPCKKAMHQSKDIRDEFQNSNVIFMYISDDSSPEEAWRNQTSEIGGIHLRINREDMLNLMELYDLIGFPSYLFFDTSHNLIGRFTSFPGERIYRRELVNIAH